MLVKVRDFIRKYKQLTFFIGLLVVGVIFAIAGILSLSKPKVEGVSVDAKIVDIKKEDAGTDGDGSTIYNYYVYVDYKDKEGNEHKNIETGSYSSSMKVGDIIEVKYNPNNPDEIINNSLIADIAFLGIGIACVVFSIVKIISVVKNKNINEYNQVDMSKVSTNQIEMVKNNKEETKEYYFHYTGKLNQSYIMETPDRVPIYEAKCDKMGVIKNSEFTFINHLTGKMTKHLVGHTVETSYDDFLTSSNAKIDNVNVWETLAKGGYSLDPHIDGMKVSFDVKRYDIDVAKIEMAGTNILKDKDTALGNVPGTGLFKIYCKESDIEMVFFSAFVLSKVKFY